jgi:KDO2-lipid IV(A) lauroyltransferase
VLVWGERLPWGRGYLVHARAFDQVLSKALATDPAQGARQINRAMERLVRECPRQYLWSYDRYKTPRAATPPPCT